MLRFRRDLVRDGAGLPIEGGSLMRFLEVSISSSGFVPVVLPLGHFCKQIKFKTLDGAGFEISNTVGGDLSMHIQANKMIEMNIAHPASYTQEDITAPMFFVKGTTTTTFELMYID